jgi:hypothetical protein
MALWGNTDIVAARPKFLKTDASGVVTEGPAKGKRLVFIDEVEAQLSNNKKKGISGAGWYLIQSKGSRTLAELVVAVSDAKRVVGGLVKDASDATEDAAGLDADDVE